MVDLEFGLHALAHNRRKNRHQALTPPDQSIRTWRASICFLYHSYG